jgi:hypothetical protein
MLFRERQNESAAGAQDQPSGAGDGGNLAQLRNAGQSLLRAADDVVRRALAGDTLEFLRATQQDGGE